jgi:hypothetical protein
VIPVLVTVRAGRFPAVPLPVILLIPLLPLAAIAVVMASLATRVDPIGALRASGRLLWALPGTALAVDDGSTSFSVTVR